MKFKSIKLKFIVLSIIGFLLTVSISATYAYFSFHETAKETAKQQTRLYAKEYSKEIKLSVDEACYISSYMALNIKNMLQNGEKEIDVKQIFNFLKNTARENDNISSVFLVMEKEAIPSGKLLKYFESVDTAGYFVPYIKKKVGGNIEIKRIDNYFDVIQKKSYTKAFKEQRQITAELEKLISNGKDLNVLPVVTPIFSANRFYGVAVVQILVSNIYSQISGTTPFEGKAKIMVLDNNNTIVALSGKEWLAGSKLEQYNGIEAKLYSQIDYRGSDLKSDNYTGSSSLFEIGNTDTEWETVVIGADEDINIDSTLQIKKTIIIASLIILIGFTILLFQLGRLFKPIAKLLHKSNQLSYGKPIKMKTLEGTNEIVQLNNSLKRISDFIQESDIVSRQIIQGKIEKFIILEDEKNELATPINRIVKNLQEIEQKRLKEFNEAQTQLWSRKGRFEIARVQRQSSGDIYELSFNLIQAVVQYSGAILGGIYLLQKDENTKKEYIETTAAYAYGIKKVLKERTEIGEGLVGTCALEKQKIIINDLPSSYIKIASGLGSTKPKSLAILPIVHNNQLIGVLEIAFIKLVAPYVIEFVEQLTENIGAWLNAAKTAQQTEILLKQTQEHAQQLTKIQQQYASASAEAETLVKALDHTVMTIEYTPDGVLQHANKIYLEHMGYKLKKLKGVNVLTLVKSQRKELEKIINSVKQGNLEEGEVIRYTAAGEPRWLRATYTPGYDADNNLTKILFFGFDITELKQNEEQLKINKKELDRLHKKEENNKQEMILLKAKYETQIRALQKQIKKDIK